MRCRLPDGTPRLLRPVCTYLLYGFVILNLSSCGEDFDDASQNTSDAASGIDDIIVTGSGNSPTPPFWNLWVESAGAPDELSFRPKSVVMADSGYRLIIDLSMLRYEFDDVIGGEAHDDIGDALRSGRYKFDILLIAEEEKIEFQSGLGYGFGELEIDSRKYQQVSDLEYVEYLEAMDANTNDLAAISSSSIGRTLIEFRTKGITGFTSLSVSIWANGLPIDEVSFQVCISAHVEHEDGESGGIAECDGGEPAIELFSGIDSYRAATSMSKTFYPDAALQFISLWDSNVIGVYRCNSCGWKDGKFLTWNTGQDENALRQYLADTIQANFELAARSEEYEEAFRTTGRALLRTLIRSSDAMEAVQLRREITKTLSELTREPQNQPPSIFVRVIGPVGDGIFQIPLGLVLIEPDGGDAFFVGQKFRVEAPMASQNYSSATECIDTWVSLVPPEGSVEVDPALANARSLASNLILGLRNWKDHSLLFESIQSFEQWLGNPLSEDGTSYTETNAVVMMLTHHENNSLFFNRRYKTPSLTSKSIERIFGSRSLVIINACGAASPGASDFLTEFNYYGVPTVVATSTTVNAKMAGDFLRILTDLLRQNEKNDVYSIGHAVFEVTNELNKTYGPRAYIYSVHGNSSIRICAPPI